MRRMAGWRLKVQPQEAEAAERLAARGLLVIDRDMFGLVTWAEATGEGRRISKALNDARRREKVKNFGHYSGPGHTPTPGGGRPPTYGDAEK